ncbi:hypothetical protein LA66_07075 [Aureimonas altamirensis]|uniref:Uncharacterized protein n=2 Tax=Aureimonas altamirensis TaxID=370622 RepID=A0A0B1QBV9_9HYPH|nr:hypothetical protein LA66_07075 [Aureimonas altamirensis]
MAFAASEISFGNLTVADALSVLASDKVDDADLTATVQLIMAQVYSREQVDAKTWGTTSLLDDAVTFAKLQNLASGTLMGRTAAGNGDGRAIPFAEIRPELSFEPLVASYGAADLNGVTQIVLDLPPGFSVFRLLAETLVSSAQGSLLLRCGPPGGSLDAGASDYTVQLMSALGSTVSGTTASGNGLGIGTTSSGGGNVIEALIVDGSAGGQWRAMITEAGPEGSNYRVSQRFGIRPVSGARKRLGIINSQPFQNFGSIKIYGVR